ncbi:NAD(P)H-binding protein [Hydrogenovibrio kuenenii]|uniref:NAD(P)H-binding protein n=1 Tax=Hydrogenovibrio kuenenii TaxID=63658 RepID=UPI0004644F78|nr:NAD(P)H-binding protein [Hydrogenovibrio kuenenii]
MFGKKVVVLAGAGFVGRSVVNELSKQGYQVRVCVRRPERFRDYGLFPNTKVFAIKDYQDEAVLKSALEDVDVVVNLLADLTAGIEAVPTKDLVVANQKVKKAVELSSAQRVISLSQLGADATKAENSRLQQLGESDAIALGASNTKNTILRTSLLLGEGDCVTTQFRKQLNLISFLPVVNASTLVQPLAVGEFAKALVSVINDETTYGQKVEVAGEERISVRQLAELVAELLGKESALIFPMCKMNARLMVKLGVLAPIKSVSPVLLDGLTIDQVTDNDFSNQFGFVPRSIEQVLSAYLLPTKVRDRYHFLRQEAGRNHDDLA